MQEIPLSIWCALAGAGAAGTLVRAAVGVLAVRWLGTSVPWGTWTVNVLGAFAIGAVCELERRYGWLSPTARYLLATGFLGGFTTFSAMSWETWLLLERGATGTAIAYALGTLVCGVAATAAGVVAARAFIAN